MQLPSFREVVVGVVLAASFAVAGYLAIADGSVEARQAIFAVLTGAAGFFLGQQVGLAQGAASVLRGLPQIGLRGRGEPPPEGMGGSGL